VHFRKTINNFLFFINNLHWFIQFILSFVGHHLFETRNIYSLKLLNRNSIWRVPVSIKNIPKLRYNGSVVCPKTNTCCNIEIVPYKVACPNVCPYITNCVFSMIHSCKIRVYISCTTSIMNGRSCIVETWYHIIFDLNFTRAFVVFGRRAEIIGIEEILQVLIGAVYEVCPICHQYLYCCMLGKHNLFVPLKDRKKISP